MVIYQHFKSAKCISNNTRKRQPLTSIRDVHKHLDRKMTCDIIVSIYVPFANRATKMFCGITLMELIRVKCLLCIRSLKGVHQRLYPFMEIQLFNRKKILPKTPGGPQWLVSLKLERRPLKTHTMLKQSHVVVGPLCPLSLPCL